MQRIFSLLLILSLLFTVSCTTPQQRLQRTTSRAVYAISDSLKAGRVDLAEKYASQLTRVVAAPSPKMRITVKPVVIPASPTAPAKQIVVLPEDLQDEDAVAVDTPTFNKIVSANPTVAKQLTEEKKTEDTFTKEVDNTQSALLREAAKPKKNFFQVIWDWIKGLGIVGMIVAAAGLICTAIFAPTFLPIVMGWFGNLFHGGITGIATFFTDLFKKKT